MQIADVKSGEKLILVTWKDGSKTEFPFIWLRDNDANELHPDTRERTFDLTTVSLEIHPEKTEFTSDALIVEWQDKADASIYTAQWLAVHRPGSAAHDPSVVTQKQWTAATLPAIPYFDATSCRESAAVLCDALQTVKRTGLIIFTDLQDDLSAGKTFGDIIGFKRRTNFGLMFEVVSEPDPVNLAYTALALPLHTDLPNQVSVPDYQFLHCYRNDAVGGDSVFADGFSICADLGKEDPDKLALLTSVAVPWRYHDDTCDIRFHRPIVSQKPDGDFDGIVFNAHLADVPDMEADVLYDFYAAYRDLMQRIRDPKYSLHVALEPGQMVMFDNHRVLHSRTEFDPSTGNRHLRGFYIERNEIDSRIRVMAREMSNSNND